MTADNHTPRPWTKAIPESRDRLQSRILLGLAAVLFLYQWDIPRYLQPEADLTNPYLGKALLIAVCFAFAAWRLRAATPMAAVAGGMICLLSTIFTSIPENVNPLRSALTPLILLFLLTFTTTKIGRKRKAAEGLAESSKGRNAAQIIANLGVAAVASSPAIGGRFPNRFEPLGNFGYTGREGRALFIILCSVPTLAALAEATADTVSSEIGQAFGGAPRMVLTLRQVPPGTDGAITLLGTFAGIAAAALIAITGIPALGMSFAECAVAFAAGVAGLFFDSLLGATLERRGWLGNDLVNFLSTAFAAMVSLIAIRFAQNTLLP